MNFFTHSILTDNSELSNIFVLFNAKTAPDGEKITLF